MDSLQVGGGMKLVEMDEKTMVNVMRSKLIARRE